MAQYGLTANLGKRTAKGTLITGAIQQAAADDLAQLEIIKDNRQEVLDAIGGALASALEEIGLVAEGYAKKACPVDTGRLRNSITHVVDPQDNSVYIGTNVEYAPVQEFGTSTRNAANDGRGFLRPAAQDHASKYWMILKKHMQDA